MKLVLVVMVGWGTIVPSAKGQSCSPGSPEGECCTPCRSGDYQGYNDIEGITCSTWDTVNQLLFEGTEECYKQRMLGVHYCDCQPPQGLATCSCPEGSQLLSTNLDTIENTKVLCRDAVRIPALDGESTCQIFRDSCCDGGNDAAGTCSLCRIRGNLPQNLTLTIFNKDETCGQWGGRLVLGDRDCHQENFNTTIDEAAYCGCPLYPPPMTCDICPRGQTVTSPRTQVPTEELISTLFNYEITMRDGGAEKIYTCQDLENIRRYIVDDDVCRALRIVAVSYCCGYNSTTNYIPPYQPPVAAGQAGGGSSAPALTNTPLLTFALTVSTVALSFLSFYL